MHVRQALAYLHIWWLPSSSDQGQVLSRMDTSATLLVSAGDKCRDFPRLGGYSAAEFRMADVGHGNVLMRVRHMDPLASGPTPGENAAWSIGKFGLLRLRWEIVAAGEPH